MKKNEIKVLTAIALGEVIWANRDKSDEEHNNVVHITSIHDTYYYLKEASKFRLELIAHRLGHDKFVIVIAEYNMCLDRVTLVEELTEAIRIYDNAMVSQC